MALQGSYDSAWRRTKVQDHAGNETSWTLDAGGNPTAWSVKDADGASDDTSTGAWKQDHVYGPVIDEVVMLEQADLLDTDGASNTSEPAWSWYMRSALGSVVLVEEQDRAESPCVVCRPERGRPASR